MCIGFKRAREIDYVLVTQRGSFVIINGPHSFLCAHKDKLGIITALESSYSLARIWGRMVGNREPNLYSYSPMSWHSSESRYKALCWRWLEWSQKPSVKTGVTHLGVHGIKQIFTQRISVRYCQVLEGDLKMNKTQSLPSGSRS